MWKTDTEKKTCAKPSFILNSNSNKRKNTMSHENIIENKEVHNLIIKGQIHSEDITILNSYAPNNLASKLYKINKIINSNWHHNLRD